MSEREPVHFSIIGEARGMPINGRTFGSSIIRPSTFLSVSGVPTDSCRRCPLRYRTIEGWGGRKRPHMMCSQMTGIAPKEEYERFMESDQQPPDYQIGIKFNYEPLLLQGALEKFANTAVCADRQNSNIDDVISRFAGGKRQGI